MEQAGCLGGGGHPASEPADLCVNFAVLRDFRLRGRGERHHHEPARPSAASAQPAQSPELELDVSNLDTSGNEEV